MPTKPMFASHGAKNILQTSALKFCYLDDYLGFSQIPIHKDDQEKTTFACPFGTFVHRRMPFGLCNTPATI
jgi:hypothetical protein